MQLISCHEGRLLTLAEAQFRASAGRAFRTGLEALDSLAPEGLFSRGAVHELLSHPAHGKPLFVATLLARSAIGVTPLAASRTMNLETAGHWCPVAARSFVREAASGVTRSGAVIWSDPHHELYPPALSLHGIPLEQVYLLHPSEADQTWAVAECLRCKGVGAVVAAIPRLTRVEARRLQLAAEAGGTTGIFLRPAGTGGADIYSAATRWLVRPAPGLRTVQRWSIQLLHGHGGRVGHTVILEYCRENHLVRATDQLADRPSRKAQPAVA
jgi:hypothetical protein